MEVNSRHSKIIQRISDMEATVESVTTGFYKFLARFSGMLLISINSFIYSLSKLILNRPLITNI